MLTLATPDELERVDDLTRRISNCSEWLFLHGDQRGTALYSRVEADWSELMQELSELTGFPVPPLEPAL